MSHLEGDYEELIHKALIDVVQRAAFNRVTFDGSRLVITGDVAPCTTAVASPIASTWREPSRNRQHRMRERAEWQWELILKLQGRASFEAFERQLEQHPPRVVRDDTHDRQVTLLLAEARYDHPPHTAVGAESRAIYRFIAELTPV